MQVLVHGTGRASGWQVIVGGRACASARTADTRVDLLSRYTRVYALPQLYTAAARCGLGADHEQDDVGRHSSSSVTW